MEKCALGVFHKNLGEDLDIPFDPLSSSEEGWRDGVHFAMDLRDWTIKYEETVAVPNDPSVQYVHAYVDSAFLSMPKWVGATMRKTLGADLDDTMRLSLGCVFSLKLMGGVTLLTITFLGMTDLRLPGPFSPCSFEPSETSEFYTLDIYRFLATQPSKPCQYPRIQKPASITLSGRVYNLGTWNPRSGLVGALVLY